MILISDDFCQKQKAPSRAGSKSTDSSSSTKDMQMIVDRLKSQQYRNSTRKNYYVVWKLFNKFFIRLDKKPDTWKDHLTLFVGYLIDNKRQFATVKSYISAVRAILMEIGVKLNNEHTQFSSLTKACRLVNDQIKTRLPIQKDLLSAIQS